MADTNFGRQYTILQALKMFQTNRFRYNQMVTKKDEDGNTEPLFYKNADGSSTKFQKVCFKDDAGNFLGTLSRKLVEMKAEGKKLRLQDCIVTERLYDREDPKTHEITLVKAYSMHLPNESADISFFDDEE